jgi:hypothetical protein
MEIDGMETDGGKFDNREVDANVPAAESVVDESAGPGPAAPPMTGDQQVDEALEPLAGIHEMPLADQVDVYAGAHRSLQDRLAGLDD